jgi:1,4-alpha-glucan branching enzyme
MPHDGVQRWVADLNRAYREEPALHQRDFSGEGFQWVRRGDWEQSVLAFMRRAADGSGPIVVVCNFTPVPRPNYRVGVPAAGFWREILNSDAPIYGGSGMGNFGGVETSPIPWDEHSHSVMLQLPPLAAVFLKPA